MKIRTYDDCVNLNVGDWIGNLNGIYCVTSRLDDNGYIRYAEVIFDTDEDGNPLETYTLANEGTMTVRELKNCEKM